MGLSIFYGEDSSSIPASTTVPSCVFSVVSSMRNGLKPRSQKVFLSWFTLPWTTEGVEPIPQQDINTARIQVLALALNLVIIRGCLSPAPKNDVSQYPTRGENSIRRPHVNNRGDITLVASVKSSAWLEVR